MTKKKLTKQAKPAPIVPIKKSAPKSKAAAASKNTPVAAKKPAAKPAIALKNKPVAKAVSSKSAPKVVPAKAKTVAKVAPTAKAKPTKPATPAPTPKATPAKTVVPAAKQAPVAPAPKAKPAPPQPAKKGAKKNDDDEPVPEITPIEKLPSLPSDIHYKRPKGKLAPGGKRFVKVETINPHVIKDKPFEPEKQSKKKEPAGRFDMEFVMHAPIGLLYDFLTTPSGLAEWFADDVDLKNDIYTFNWDGSKQHARIEAAKLDSFIRLHWLDKPEGTFFEFRIEADELTNEISLLIADFGDGDDDIKTNRQLWDAQIHRLIKAMGAY